MTFGRDGEARRCAERWPATASLGWRRLTQGTGRTHSPCPGTLLQVATKNKATGAPLRAHQIVGQVNSVLVAGHDTTSFMLASALYYVATNEGARAKMVAEVDAFGRGRDLRHEDLESFPYVEVGQ
jgi:cytochrome P450